MALIDRRIEVTFSLAEGSFGDTGQNTVTVSGLRTSCKILKAGGLSDSSMELQVYGLTQSIMDKLSTLGMQINLVPKNAVVVTAGDATSGMGTVFVGYVLAAYTDFQDAPNVSFRVSAHTGLPDAVIPTPVSSFKGSTDVATIMSGFATLMGLKFENSGVDVKLANPYFSGSVKSQAKACVAKAGIAWNGGDNGVLAIWPRNGARGGTVPLVSPETGLIGYPSYNAYGLTLKTLFNPSISFGGKIEVKSSLKPACGTWAVYSIDHDLDSQVLHGSWFSTIGAYNPKFPTPVAR